MNEQPIPFKELLGTLVRRRALIAKVVVIGMATAFVLAWLEPPTYMATAKLIVTPKRATIAASPDANTSATVQRPDDEQINGEITLLRSPALVREVLAKHENEQIKRKDKPTWLTKAIRYPLSIPGRIYRALHHVKPPTDLDHWVDNTVKKLAAFQIGRSNLIAVSFTARNPEWAATLVNELVSHHITRQASLNEQSGTRQFFSQQKDMAATNLEHAQDALKAFGQRAGSEVLAQNEPELRNHVVALEASLADARTKLAEASARAKFLASEAGAQPGAGAGKAAPSSSVQLVMQRIVELELQKTQLLGRYAPTSTVIKSLDKQIADIRKLLPPGADTAGSAASVSAAFQKTASDLVQAQSEEAALEARVAALQTQVDGQRSLLAKVASLSSEHDRLTNEVTTAREAYLTYLRKEEEARFTNALDESRIVNLTIAEPAAVPTQPEQSKRALVLVLGFLLSLAAGIALAFLLDWLDPTVKTAAQASRATGIPVIGEIPS